MKIEVPAVLTVEAGSKLSAESAARAIDGLQFQAKSDDDRWVTMKLKVHP